MQCDDLTYTNVVRIDTYCQALCWVLGGERFRPGLCLLSPHIPVGKTEDKQINTTDPHHSWIPCCKFAYLLQFICNPPINTCVGREVNGLSSLICPFLANIGQDDALTSCCRCRSVNQHSFCGLKFSAWFSVVFVRCFW